MTTEFATNPSPQVFGAVHLVLLGVTVLASVLAVWGMRRIQGVEIRTKILRRCGWVLLGLALFQTIWSLLPANWNIGSALPLHYSDVLRFVPAIALIRQSRWAVAISYYWGLTLNPQAIITPHPSILVVPSVDFVLYWVLHITVFVAPLVLVWGIGWRPQWRDFWRTYAVAIAWAMVIMPINVTLGTNYGFVNHPPDGASLIDWLGPWPIYVVWMAVIAGILWAVMTWPWVLRHRNVLRVRAPDAT